MSLASNQSRCRMEKKERSLPRKPPTVSVCFLGKKNLPFPKGSGFISFFFLKEKYTTTRKITHYSGIFLNSWGKIHFLPQFCSCRTSPPPPSLNPPPHPPLPYWERRCRNKPEQTRKKPGSPSAINITQVHCRQPPSWY